MKLGEKLQQLRKKSGLSQEQLAARLTVSRQAVSKWELDDAVPDTENVVQLSRLFGVSCDYLLREELDEPDAAPVPAVQEPPQPTPSGEAHLDQEGWIHNACVLSLAVCSIGLVSAFMGLIVFHSARALAVGLIIQVVGMGLFELAAPRMGNERNATRLGFYATACWLILPLLVFLTFNRIDYLLGWHTTALRALACYFAADVLASAAVTAVLLFLRRRARAKA